MAQPLDSSQFEEVSDAQAPSMGGSIESAPQTLDSSQFETLPSYADGASPETPINQSPIGVMDRAAMSMGNAAGNLRFLKSRYEDAMKDKDGDLLVKDQGVWHRVDPTNLGEPDAWEATKKLLKSTTLMGGLYSIYKGDTKDAKIIPQLGATLANKAARAPGVALDIGGSMGGTALGAMTAPVTGPAGAIVGSGAGAAAGEAIRTSLGRLAGTYYATPEQQVKDIGWEGLLGSGGEAVALGVKPALPVLRKALGTIGDTATNFAKENLSALWGTLTDAGRWATRRAMDDAPNVIGKATQAIEAIGPRAARSEAVDFASSRQNTLVNSLAESSKTALQRNYGQQLLQLVKEVPDDFSSNVGAMMKEVQADLVASGYGKMVGPEGAQRFAATSIDDIAEKMGMNSEQLPKIMGEKTQAAIQQIARLTNQYGKLGTLSGKSGARQMVDLKKALGESFDDLYAEDVPKSIQRIATQIKDSMSEKIGQTFADHGVGDQYVRMNKQYSTYKDAVDTLNRAVDKGQTDAVVKHLVSKAGSYRTFKDEVAHLATLMGESGQKALNDIADWEAAKGFVDFVPKSMGGNSAITIGKLAGTATQQANPRVVGKQIEYGSRALDFIKGLPPKQLRQLLSDDKTFLGFITPLMQAYDGEDQAVQQLLQGSGAIGGSGNGQQ